MFSYKYVIIGINIYTRYPERPELALVCKQQYICHIILTEESITKIVRSNTKTFFWTFEVILLMYYFRPNPDNDLKM